MLSNQFNIKDYLDIALLKWRLIVITFIITTVISMIIGILLPKSYKSSTLILVERQQIPESYVRSTVGVEIGERLQTITQQITSRSLLEQIINTLNVDGTSKAPMEVKVETMRKNIEIQIRGRNVFILSFKGDNPETVMKVVNMLASLFIEENLKVREQQAAGTSEFLENELNLIKLKLEAKEKTLKEYKTQYIGELPEQMQANLASLTRFQQELQATTDGLRSAEDRKVILQRQIEERKKELERQIGLNPLQNKLDALRAELADLQSRYTDKYPDIPRLKREIKETEDKLMIERESRKEEPSIRLNTDIVYQNMVNQLSNIEFEILNLRDRQKNVTEQTKIYQQRVENIPTREQQLITLSRDYDNLKANYQSLLNRKLEAQISENLEKRQKGERFRIVDPANLPQVPFSPNMKMVLLAALLFGVATAFGSAFLLELIKPGFKKPKEVEDMIGLPVFATIPNFFMFNTKTKG